MPKLRLSKIRDDVPFGSVKQREDGNPLSYVGAAEMLRLMTRPSKGAMTLQ